VRQLVKVHLSSSLWAREDPRPWVVILTDDGYNAGSRAKSLGRYPNAKIANAKARGEARRRGVEVRLAETNPRNPDDQLRELERQAAQGDTDAEAALIRARIRNSTLFEEQVRLLADLGDEAAVRAIGMTPTTLRLWDPVRLKAGGPVYGALACLAVLDEAVAMCRDDPVLIEWVQRVRKQAVLWISGEGRRGTMTPWLRLRTEGAGHRTDQWELQQIAMNACMAFGCIEEWPQGSKHEWHDWPTLTSWSVIQAVNLESSAPGVAPHEAQRKVATRVLQLVKPWVWARGPSEWKIPQRNPQAQLALIGNPPPPWVDVISDQPGRSDLWVGAFDRRTGKRIGYLHVDLRRSWDPGKDLWGRPPLPIARVSNIRVSPEYMRQGIGTALYKAAADHVAKLGYHLASDTGLSQMS